MCLGKNSETLGDSYFQEIVIKNTESQGLLVVTIDGKLNFEEPIITICQTKRKKLNDLTRLSYPYQLRLILNPFIKSVFNYCLFIWMFSSRRADNQVNPF